jgi:allophanate hydrolase
MIRAEAGASIEIEVWELAAEHFGMFVARVPSSPLIGNIKLASGEWVKGFPCEEIALAGAVEITEFGAWRTYLASLQSGLLFAETPSRKQGPSYHLPSLPRPL